MLTLGQYRGGGIGSENKSLTPEMRLKISDVELGFSFGLFSAGVVTPYLIPDEKRQNIETPMFVFGTVLFIEGIRLRKTVPDIKNVRYWSKRKYPKPKYGW